MMIVLVVFKLILRLFVLVDNKNVKLGELGVLKCLIDFFFILEGIVLFNC